MPELSYPPGILASMRDLRAEEEWARRLIARHLAVIVEQHDDGLSPSMHDLQFRYFDGRRGAVEVTSAADPELIQWWNLANGRDGRWQEEGLTGGWIVVADPSSRVRQLHDQLPGFLAVLENQKLTNLKVKNWGRADPNANFARRLGVISACQSGTEFPGSIYLTVDLPLERSAGMVADNGDAAAEWVGDSLPEDVVSKLRRSGAEERHAFVILPPLTTAPFEVSYLLIREDAVLPTVDPRLPDGVTHVWIVSTLSSGIGFYWDPESGWSGFSKAQDSVTTL